MLHNPIAIRPLKRLAIGAILVGALAITPWSAVGQEATASPKTPARATKETSVINKNETATDQPLKKDVKRNTSSDAAGHVGGEPDGIVQVANLVYAGFKSSKCFSDHFLIKAEKESAISTSRRFHAVKLGSEDIYNFPLLIMTGEGAFQLTDSERHNLRQFIDRGGFLLSSAGCSSQDWDRSFRREMAQVFADRSLAPLAMDHPVFHTIYDIESLGASHGQCRPLEGISLSGRLGVIYSQDGLNDTAHTTGCCCCGGNEISNAVEVNVNILAYVLTH